MSSRIKTPADHIYDRARDALRPEAHRDGPGRRNRALRHRRTDLAPNYSILHSGGTYYLLDFDTLRPFANYDVVKSFGTTRMKLSRPHHSTSPDSRSA